MPLLQENFYLQKIGLFGSNASNEATPESDIDFVVRLTPPIECYIENKEALRDYLKKLFKKKN